MLVLLNPIYGISFNQLFHAGADSSYLMRGTLKTLADMYKLPDEDFPFRKQVFLIIHVFFRQLSAMSSVELILSLSKDCVDSI